MIRKFIFLLPILTFSVWIVVNDLDSRPGGGGSYRSSSSSSSGSSSSGGGSGGGDGDFWTFVYFFSGLGAFMVSRKDFFEAIPNTQEWMRFPAAGILCLLGAFASGGSPTSSAVFLAFNTVFPFIVLYFAVYDLFKPRESIYVAKKGVR